MSWPILVRVGESGAPATSRCGAFYTLADEPRETILVACSKCEWRAAFLRDDLIASHGADYPMPNLLNHLAHRVAAGSALIGIAAAFTTSSQSKARDSSFERHGRHRWSRQRPFRLFGSFEPQICGEWAIANASVTARPGMRILAPAP